MDAFNLALLLEVMFVVSAMAFIGVSVSWSQVRDLLRQRRQLVRGLIANLVLAPLLAVVLIWVFEMPVDAEVALLLLAFAPGGMNMLQFTTKIKGRLAHAAAALLVLTVIALLIVPLAILFVPLPRAPGEVTALGVVAAVLAAVLAPMALGAVVRHRSPKTAKKVARPLNLVSTVSFVAAIIVSASLKKDAAQVITGTVLLVLVLFVVGTLLIGWAMGGRDAERRQFLATVTSIRNAGLVLLVSMVIFPRSGIDIVVLAYMLLIIPPNAVLTITHKVREKRHRKVVESPGA
jgi:BASS family bile acid:Na+ symporter